MLGHVRRLVRPAAVHARTAVRTMGGGHGHHGPHISPLHTNVAKGFLVVTFLWIFYRAKEDGAVLLGLRHPWDGHHGGHGHSSGPVKYEYSELDTTPVLVEGEEEEEEHH